VNIKILDRTALILNLIVSQTTTHEQSIQTEYALLSYYTPRMTTYFAQLIKTAQRTKSNTNCLYGVNYFALETDTSIMKKRMSQLRRLLETYSNQKIVQRENRRKSGLPVVVVSGYVGAGKSSLFSALSASLSDKDSSYDAFSTLTSVTRRITPKILASKATGSHCPEFILTDTMGLIADLPDCILKAFRANLIEEIEAADILIHVVDVSNPLWKKREVSVLRQLAEMGGGNKVLMTVFNKNNPTLNANIPLRKASVCIDALDDPTSELDKYTSNCLDTIKESLSAFMVEVKATLPYFKSSTWSCLNLMFNVGTLIDVKYDNSNVHVTGRVPKDIRRRIVDLASIESKSSQENSITDGPVSAELERNVLLQRRRKALGLE
jgi:GTPase